MKIVIKDKEYYTKEQRKYLRENVDKWMDVDVLLPNYANEASIDVIWAVIRDNKIERWGRGNVGMDGQWYKDCLSLNNIPTHWMYLPNRITNSF